MYSRDARRGRRRASACSATSRPPRPGSASAGRSHAERQRLLELRRASPETCAPAPRHDRLRDRSVSRASPAPSPAGAPSAVASTCHASRAPAGTSTSQRPPAPRPPRGRFAGRRASARRRPCYPARRSRRASCGSAAPSYCARVNIGAKRSPSRTSGGSPDSSIRSCVERIVALPVPNRSAPAMAIATMRKLVSESLSGTSTVAFAVGVERDAALPEEQRVEQLARATRARRRRRAATPCGRSAACRSPASARSRSIPDAAPAHHRVEQIPAPFGASSSRPSSTAASATSPPAGGAVPSGVRRGLSPRLIAHRVGGCVGADAARRAVRLPADADLGGAEPERRLAEIDERGGAATSATRPRTSSTETKTLGASLPLIGTSTTGSRPDERRTKVSSTPSRSTVTSAVAPVKRHAHLKARRLARLVALLLRQDVHAIAGGAAEPPVLARRDPGRRHRRTHCPRRPSRATQIRSPDAGAATSQTSSRARRSFRCKGRRSAASRWLVICVEAADQPASIRIVLAESDGPTRNWRLGRPAGSSART